MDIDSLLISQDPDELRTQLEQKNQVKANIAVKLQLELEQKIQYIEQREKALKNAYQ
ncbi:hypothetical protein ACL2XK_10815 [Sodalis sp. RH23]|uniref:hypothetical protein n=1 Tax=unclassified Sodalis (in: enterobacteria) TaxID=2636512 RepID=UPI00396592C3